MTLLTPFALASLTVLTFSAPATLSTRLEPARATTRADVLEDRLLALESMVNSTGGASLERYLAEHLAPAYVESAGRAELLALLARVRETCRNPGGIGVEQEGEHAYRITFESERGLWIVRVEVEATPAHRITKLSLEEGERPESLPPFTWADCAEQLEAYEDQGFCGAVILMKDGERVIERGYGEATKDVPNTVDTLFAIGSTPIDFTKAAILLLEERGELSTKDLLSKHLEGVPKDKAAITIEHLMTGASGLRNFHGIRGVDEDLDLAYIDRAEALRRIFAQELLFAPGTEDEHSHSAWGVLAAVVEVVSGRGYGEFLREELFEPAGMERTGLYPHALAFEDAEVAVGVGEPALGKPNTPKNWGETSWLVMGSGGMVSTANDLATWIEALRAGALLAPESLEKYWGQGALAGSNDRGFLTVYTEGPGDLVVLCSNSHTRSRDLADGIGEGLARLVLR